MITKPPYPEEVRWINHLWRPLCCLGAMRKNLEFWGHTDQQVMDSQYCLDRYSLVDAKHGNP